MLLMEEYVLNLKEKQQHNIGFPNSNCPQILTLFMTYPLTIFDDFGI